MNKGGVGEQCRVKHLLDIQKYCERFQISVDFTTAHQRGLILQIKTLPCCKELRISQQETLLIHGNLITKRSWSIRQAPMSSFSMRTVRIFTSKCNKGFAPGYLSDRFATRFSVYCNKCSLNISVQLQIGWGQRTLLHRAIILWNSRFAHYH